MVLAMFVDSGRGPLLSALGGGLISLSPSILDSSEWPVQAQTQPQSEFVKGMARFNTLQDPGSRARLVERERFLQAESGLWVSATPTLDELSLATALSSREERQRAKAIDPRLRIARVDPGEAECAAIAITRSLPFWSDDSGMVPMLRILYPEVQVFRTCALLAESVNKGFLTYPDALGLYEGVFKSQLGLRSRALLRWQDQQAFCVLPP